MLFDSHIHLDFFSSEIPEHEELSEQTRVIGEAVASGITAFFVPGTRMNQWQKPVQLCSAPPVGGAQFYAGLGQHPYWASEVKDLEGFGTSLAESVQRVGAVAIGECGLDKKRGGAMAHQVALFETHLSVAKELNLPCIVHCVGTQAELFASLDRVGLGPAGGVVHGFSGERSFAQALTRRGLLLGLGPAVTRTSRQRLREAVAELPEESYVLETDAPDQRVNPASPQGSPLDLIRVAQELVNLREQPFERISEQSTRNARRLFGLKSD